MTIDRTRQLVQYAAVQRSAWRTFRPPVDGHAAVSVDRAGRLTLLTRQPSAGEIFFRPPTGVYWVDVAVHHNSCRFELPTAEGVFTFTAEVDVTWRVADPEKVVKDRPATGEQVYRPYLERQLRRLSREYQVEHFAIAEREINDHFDKPIALDCGISLLSCTVKLSPEASTHAYLQEATFDHRKAQRREAEHGARMHTAQLQSSENESQHGLQLQTSHQSYELTKFAQQRSLELEQQRMSFYAEAIQRGDLSPLAYRLASNRSDVNEVIGLMMQQKQVDFDAAYAMVKALLNQNLVNKRDAEDILTYVSAAFADQVNPASVGTGSVAPPKPELVVSPMAALVQDAEVLDRSDDDDDDDD
ncbi:SPFH domain-containing protein [Nocardia sp. NPDC004750]